MEKINQGYGFVKDVMDIRDYKLEDKLYGSSALSDGIIFEEIDLCLDECMPDTYESQGAVNDCVAYSWTKTMELHVSRIFKKKFRTNNLRLNNALSKKFLYYTTRFVTGEGSELKDCGISFRYCAKVLMGNGICTQNMFSDLSVITLKPSYDALMEANLYKINAYYTVTTLQGILASLKLGLPVQIGVDFNAISDAEKTGYSAKSKLWDSNTVFNPNHGMVILGTTFRQNEWCFKIGNSHGETWGDGKGYCYINAERMWKYNIAQAMVFVLDKLVSELDVENEDYLTGEELPCNSILIGKNGYDLNYANDANNEDEIRTAVVSAKGNVFVKSASGELFDNMTGNIITMTKITNCIGNEIIYKDKSGVISSLHVI